MAMTVLIERGEPGSNLYVPCLTGGGCGFSRDSYLTLSLTATRRLICGCSCEISHLSKVHFSLFTIISQLGTMLSNETDAYRSSDFLSLMSASLETTVDGSSRV